MKPQDAPRPGAPDLPAAPCPPRPLGCDEVSPLLHLLVEEELDELRAGWVRSHLSGCESCRIQLDALRAERLFILETALEGPRLPASFAAKVADRIREERGTSRRLRRLRVLAGSAAAAAVLLAAVLALDPGRAVVVPPTPDEVASLDRARAGMEEEPTSPEATAVADAATPAGTHATLAAPEPERRCVDGFSPDLLGDEDPWLPILAHAEDETTPSPGSDGAGCQCSFDDIVVFTSWVTYHSGRDPGDVEARFAAAPCPPDPNADGRTDGSDVAYYWQQLLRTTDAPAGPAPTAASEPLLPYGVAPLGV